MYSKYIALFGLPLKTLILHRAGTSPGSRRQGGDGEGGTGSWLWPWKHSSFPMETIDTQPGHKQTHHTVLLLKFLGRGGEDKEALLGKTMVEMTQRIANAIFLNGSHSVELSHACCLSSHLGRWPAGVSPSGNFTQDTGTFQLVTYFPLPFLYYPAISLWLLPDDEVTGNTDACFGVQGTLMLSY